MTETEARDYIRECGLSVFAPNESPVHGVFRPIHQGYEDNYTKERPIPGIMDCRNGFFRQYGNLESLKEWYRQKQISPQNEDEFKSLFSAYPVQSDFNLLFQIGSAGTRAFVAGAPNDYGNVMNGLGKKSAYAFRGCDFTSQDGIRRIWTNEDIAIIPGERSDYCEKIMNERAGFSDFFQLPIHYPDSIDTYDFVVTFESDAPFGADSDPAWDDYEKSGVLCRMTMKRDYYGRIWPQLDLTFGKRAYGKLGRFEIRMSSSEDQSDDVLVQSEMETHKGMISQGGGDHITGLMLYRAGTSYTFRYDISNVKFSSVQSLWNCIEVSSCAPRIPVYSGGTEV